MLTQLLSDRNEYSDNDECEDEMTLESKNAKESSSSSIDVKVIKGIQAQIASLTQRDELKKVGMTRPYPLEWYSVPYPPKFKPPTLHVYHGKSSPNQHIYYFRSQTGNVIDNDAIMVRLWHPQEGSFWLVQEPSKWLH